MFETVLQRLNNIPADKVAHFAAGVVLFALFVHIINPINSLLVVSAIGVGKEIYDNQNKDKHSVELLDALATILGGFVGYVIAF